MATNDNYVASKIFVTVKDSLNLIIVSNIQTVSNSLATLSIHQVKLLPEVIFYPLSKSQTLELALTAYSSESGSMTTLGNTKLEYGSGSSGGSGSSDDNNTNWYKNWYIWVAVLASVIIVSLGLIIALCIVKRQKKKREMESLLSVDKKFSLN